MGLRASGKSTLARAIGEREGVPAYDLDDLVLDELGAATVREAWERLGEDAFRAAETRALRAALATDTEHILALGGGTPTAPGASDVLREAVESRRCALFYLRLKPDALRARTREDDPDRPSLTGAGALDEIQHVFDQRDPLYRALAMHEHAPTSSVDEDARALIALWNTSARGAV